MHEMNDYPGDKGIFKILYRFWIILDNLYLFSAVYVMVKMPAMQRQTALV